MRLHNEDRSIQIKGDGVAVGNNNHITVIRERHRRKERPDADGAGQATAAGVLATAIVTVLYGVHAFARHADAVYQSFGVFALATLVAGVGVTWLWWRYEEWGRVMKSSVIATLAGIAALGLAGAYEAYPKELIALSTQSDGGRAFICGLSAYGRQVAMTHAVTASLGFGGGLLLLLSVVCSDGTGLWRGDWFPGASQLGSWVCVAVGAVLILAASWQHAGRAPSTALDLPAPLTLLICGVTR